MNAVDKMGKDQTPIILYPSNRKFFRLLFTSVVFTLIGVWMVSDKKSMGWFVLIFFGVCCVVFTWILLSKGSYLRLSEEGFEIRVFNRGEVIAWNDIVQFEFRYIGPTKMVVFNYNADYTKNDAGKKLAENLTGVEGALPDTYGKSAEELAELLNEWREKYSKK